MTPEEIAARGGGETPFLHLPAARHRCSPSARCACASSPRGHAMRRLPALHGRAGAGAAGPAGELPARAAARRRRARPRREARRAAAAGRRLAARRRPGARRCARSLAADLRAHAPGAGAGGARRRSPPADRRLARAPGRLPADRRDGRPGPGHRAGDRRRPAGLLDAHGDHAAPHTATAAASPSAASTTRRVCPCCGSRPTASVTRSSGESLGQRYLHCSLCSLQWHLVRIKCTHCLSTKRIAYQSLEAAGADEQGDSRAASAALQAESCDDCGALPEDRAQRHATPTSSRSPTTWPASRSTCWSPRPATSATAST